MLWIRIGFNADPHPDPAFYLNADPDPGQTFKSQKVEFLHKNIINVGNRATNKPTKVQNPF